MKDTKENECWQLQVSDDRRALVKADGRPWFWLGDTAWDLFIRLDRENVHTYYRNRQEKGFSVIQGVVIMGYHVDFNTPNIYGHKPFVDDDPTKPDLRAKENFWTHADYIIDAAREHGIYIGILPMWGYHIGGNHDTPVMFTKESARAYAEFIAERYRDRPNIIWINGGDIVGDEHGESDVEIWRAIGETIKRVDSDHLVTYHPRGKHSSSLHFHGEPWLDFNMIQSGHSQIGFHNDDQIEADYNRTPTKPVLEGEPRYESHPVNWNPHNGFFNDYDARQAAYWSLFAGAFGHTYGHVNMWRFNIPGKKQATERFDMMDLPWEEVMDYPGAFQMSCLRNLMLSRPQKGRRPFQALLARNYEGEARIRVTLGDGYAFVYTPYGYPTEVKRGELSWSKSCCWWYDPRTGASYAIDESPGGEDPCFTPPGKPYRSNDWVLVIDDGSRKFSAPGVVRE